MEIVIRLHPTLARDIESRSADGGLPHLVQQAVRVVAKFGPNIVYARIAARPLDRRAGRGPGADHAMSARSIGRHCVLIEIDAADTAVTSRIVVPGQPCGMAKRGGSATGASPSGRGWRPRRAW